MAQREELMRIFHSNCLRCNADRMRHYAATTGTGWNDLPRVGSSISLDISHDGRTANVRDRERRQTRLREVASDLDTRYADRGISVLRSGGNHVHDAAGGATSPWEPLQR